jgi:hypothetical protein
MSVRNEVTMALLVSRIRTVADARGVAPSVTRPLLAVAVNEAAPVEPPKLPSVVMKNVSTNFCSSSDVRWMTTVYSPVTLAWKPVEPLICTA